jgi:cation diffusion facilitator CzcD-associated flavoprotein CzcO
MAVGKTLERAELLDATDEQIEDAVGYADPMALRGLLYLLTGNDKVSRVPTLSAPLAGGFSFIEAHSVPDHADVEWLRSQAVEFLKGYRDEGAPQLEVSSPERLRRSVGLAVGHDIPEGEIDLWIEMLALDPWVRGVSWREEPSSDRLDDFSVAVIGAGMGGLIAAVQMKRIGIPFAVYEKNPAVGGTWYENRYPGARVDTPSRGYTCTFAIEYPFLSQWSEQRDNERYFNWIADKYEVRDDIVFNTEVRSIVWDDTAEIWELEIVGPEGTQTVRASAVISCVGYLSRPNIPEIEGMDEFSGAMFHTARWPEDLDLTDKRVAVVGTGCTGYQMIPVLAKQTAHTYVLQRKPNWCFDAAGYLAPHPPQISWLERNFPFHANFMRLRAEWMAHPEQFTKAFGVDPAYDQPGARSQENKRLRDNLTAFLERKLAGHPDLIEKMTPVQPPLSARPILVDVDDNIFDALLRDDVTLITSGIGRITKHGFVTGEGDEYEVDAIVLATGFRANDYLWPMEVRGRGGRRLEELWAKDGARAYIGTMLPGFPNFFMVYGPNASGTGGLNIPDLEEMTIRFALECFRGLIEQGKSTVEVTDDAYRRYNEEVDRWEATRIWHDKGTDSYWKNDFGRSSNLPIDARKLWSWLRSPTAPLPDTPPLIVDGPVEGEAEIEPYFGKDLTID